MKRPGYKYLLAVLDILVVNLSFVLALRFQLPSHRPIFFDQPPYAAPEVLFFVLYSLCVVLLFQHHNLYKINVFLTVADHSVRIAKSMVYAVLGLAVLSFFTKSDVIVESRLAILYFTLLSFGLFLLVRVVLFRRVFLIISAGQLYQRSAVILGSGSTARMLAANLQLNNPYGLRLLGFVDDDLPVGTVVFAGLKVVGTTREVNRLVRDFDLAELIVCLDDVSHEDLIETLDRCSSTPARVTIASPLYSVISERLFTERYGNVPVVGITSSRSILQETFKRTFDLVVGGAGFVLLLPVFAAIALAIKLDSPGPVLYKQIRLGKNGKPFTFYKFRSMAVGSDRDSGRMERVVSFIKAGDASINDNGSTKIVNETHVTRVGRMLRRTSLDELPQLFNVLMGDMSLVGPRPCLPYEWEHYEAWHKKRLAVTPGCTGVWQVSGRSIVGFDDMVILDLYYIHSASLLLDMQLILKTVPVMLFGKGAK